jgi:hypothetical protein
MNTGFYITSKGIKNELVSTYTIMLSYNDLIELVIPYGVKEVACYDNKLTKLDLPDSVKIINCHNNNLTKLIIPDSVEYIDCRYNQLTELVVPDNCKVKCDNKCVVITRTMYNRSKRLKQILK